MRVRDVRISLKLCMLPTYGISQPLHYISNLRSDFKVSRNSFENRKWIFVHFRQWVDLSLIWDISALRAGMDMVEVSLEREFYSASIGTTLMGIHEQLAKISPKVGFWRPQNGWYCFLPTYFRRNEKFVNFSDLNSRTDSGKFNRAIWRYFSCIL